MTIPFQMVGPVRVRGVGCERQARSKAAPPPVVRKRKRKRKLYIYYVRPLFSVHDEFFALTPFFYQFRPFKRGPFLQGGISTSIRRASNADAKSRNHPPFGIRLATSTVHWQYYPEALSDTLGPRSREFHYVLAIISRSQYTQILVPT